MEDFKNEYLQEPTPSAPAFKPGDRVAYSPNSGQTLHGMVIAEASEPRRYVVRFDDRTRAIDAHSLSKLPN